MSEFLEQDPNPNIQDEKFLNNIRMLILEKRFGKELCEQYHDYGFQELAENVRLTAKGKKPNKVDVGTIFPEMQNFDNQLDGLERLDDILAFANMKGIIISEEEINQARQKSQ